MMSTLIFYRRKYFNILLKSASGISGLLDRVAKRRVLIIILIGVLAFTGSMIVSTLSGFPPKPCIHDEFAYLLAADTFASGRLTNPAHPMWQHFESFHILQIPTYMSPYFPGQGLILAFGQVAFGHPIIGVWISVFLMCCAICWMLYQWLPPKWAAIGGLIAVLNIAPTYWSQSYWGGALAAFGGALFFGGLRNVIFKSRATDSLLMAFGLAILMNTRPFEALIVCIPTTVLMITWIIGKKRTTPKKLFINILIPVVILLLATTLWLAVYNKAVTGNPFITPQSVCAKQESSVPIFIWQRIHSQIQYRHQELQKCEDDFMRPNYFKRRYFKDVFHTNIMPFISYWKFYIGYILTIPLIIGALWLVQNIWVRLALLCIFLISFIEPALISFITQIHYSAPIACLFIYLACQGLRSLRFLRLRNKSIGMILALLILSLFLISSAGRAINRTLIIISPKRMVQIKKYRDRLWADRRYEIINRLKSDGGRHLIIVRYGKLHSVNDEWVYNNADIDGSAVVWARDMGEAENRKLFEYFKDRKIWLLEVSADDLPPSFAPYTSSSNSLS